jgi:hypothetical protein
MTLVVDAELEVLLERVRALPPMTPAEVQEQRLSWAYGQLACSTNHKPTLEGLRAIAVKMGWDRKRFAGWAIQRKWW